jgi:hypothetical protein
MKIRLALIFCFFAAMANAEVISFRSGDHPGFARIVADIPVGATWQIGRVGQSYALQVETRHSFDTGSIFDRIQRNRLATVRQEADAGRLFLDLACNCHVDAFLFQPDKLVIDIKDGPPPGSSPFETPLSEADPQSLAEIPLLVARTGPDPIGAFSDLPDLLQQMQPRVRDVTPAEQALIESLERATLQGLLDADSAAGDVLAPAAGPIVGPVGPVLTTPPSVEIPLRPLETTNDVVAADEQGLSIQTVIDRDSLLGESQLLSSSGEVCLDDRHFDVAAWSASEDFATEIGSRREGLVQEDGQFSGKAVEELARTYLFFGFGKEAVATSALDGVRDSDRDIVVAIAQIIDDEPVTGHVFADQDGCARPVALWRALGRKSLEGTTEPERIAVAMAHRVLPENLRNLLSPRLASLFLEAGDPTMAEAIRAPTAMTPIQPEDALTASIARETGGSEAALATAERVVSEDHRASPAAIVSLIELSLEENQPVDDEILVLAEALRFENQGTPDELSLGSAEFRALLSADRFAEARDVISDLNALPDNERQAYLTDLTVSISERSPDNLFLELFFSNGIDTTSASAGNAVARRLMDLGFFSQAADLIRGQASGEDMAERRYLRAEAAANLDQFEDVDEILSGMSDPRSIALLERSSGDFTTLEAATSTDPVQSWRNGAWTELRAGSDPVLQTAARAMLSEPIIPSIESTLAEREALIVDAEVTRTLADELLDRFQIAPESEAPLPQ